MELQFLLNFMFTTVSYHQLNVAIKPGHVTLSRKYVVSMAHRNCKKILLLPYLLKMRRKKGSLLMTYVKYNKLRFMLSWVNQYSSKRYQPIKWQVWFTAYWFQWTIFYSIILKFLLFMYSYINILANCVEQVILR